MKKLAFFHTPFYPSCFFFHRQKHILFEKIDEKNNHGRDDPADRIDDHEGFVGRCFRKNGIDPENTSTADSEQADHGRDKRIPIRAHEIGKDFAGRVDGLEGDNPAKPDEAVGDNDGILRKDAKRKASGYENQNADQNRADDVLEQAETKRFFAAIVLTGSTVLANEGCAGLA